MNKKAILIMVSVMIVTLLTGCNHVKLCDYIGVEATKVVYEVTDEDVQEEIEYAMYDYVTYEPITDRGVEVGDYATITYTATIDGEENADYSGENEEVLVGEGWLYEELEEALVGMKAGEKKQVELVLTEDYAEEDMVGKKATIDVTVNEISVENMPEYNLDFVKEYTDYDTLEEYEAAMKEDLIATKEEEYKYIAVEEIFTYIIDNSKFNGYPKELYEQCEENYNSSNEFYASMYGMSLEEFMEMYGIDEETKKQEIEASVNYELVIQAIAKEQKIDVDDKDITAYIEEIYADYDYESAEEFLQDYTTEEVKSELIYQKVCDFLYENAKLKEISEEEYLTSQEESNGEISDEVLIDDESIEGDAEEDIELLEE